MILSSNKKEKEQCFKQLFEEYYAPFCLYAKRFIDDRESREDIVSDVFAVVWQKIDSDELRPETAVGISKCPYEINASTTSSIRNTNGITQNGSSKRHRYTPPRPTRFIRWTNYTVCFSVRWKNSPRTTGQYS